jgi:hypothetical protein
VVVVVVSGDQVWMGKAPLVEAGAEQGWTEKGGEREWDFQTLRNKGQRRVRNRVKVRVDGEGRSEGMKASSPLRHRRLRRHTKD